MVHPHYSGSALGFFFLILHSKKGEHLHEIITIIFPKKFYWQMSYFVPEIDTS